MSVYLLKEMNLLDSGELEFFVNVYATEDKAKKAMEEDISEHIENNGAYISDGKIGEWVVKLSDEEGNNYSFEIERAKVE